MRYLNHKKIKTFTQDLIVKDSSIIERQKDEFIRNMVITMRDSGYIPVIDIDVVSTSERDLSTGSVKLTVSVYGVFVGKEKAWRLEGIEVSNSGRVYPSASREAKANS